MVNCPNNYSICVFFKSKSVFKCMKELPGDCIQKWNLIKETMFNLNINKDEAKRYIENIYEK